MSSSPSEPTLLEKFHQRLVSRVVKLIRHLRNKGARVPLNAGITAVQSLQEVGIRSKSRVRTALLTTLVSRHEDIPIFHQYFDQFWTWLTEALEELEEQKQTPFDGAVLSSEFLPEQMESMDEDQGMDTDRYEDDDGEGVPLQRSLSDEDPASGDIEHTRRSYTYSPGGSRSDLELNQPRQSFQRGEMEQFLRQIATQPGRRHSPAPSGPRLDARRAIRQSFQTGGQIMSLPRLRRDQTVVRCTVLVDVSRSVLDSINQSFLMDFLREIHHASVFNRIFFFDSEIREVTTVFQDLPPDASIEQLARGLGEWGGGTRIGHSLQMLKQHAPYAVDSDTLMIIISDGLDRGDMDQLERGIVWLHRVAGSLLWLNPLASYDDYEPTCRGMALSLPFLDGLFAFSQPGDLAEIARQLRLRGMHGSIGYQHDLRRQAS